MTLADSFPFCEELGLVSVIHDLENPVPIPSRTGLGIGASPCAKFSLEP